MRRCATSSIPTRPAAISKDHVLSQLNDIEATTLLASIDDLAEALSAISLLRLAFAHALHAASTEPRAELDRSFESLESAIIQNIISD